MQSVIVYLGLVASILVSLAYVPQVIKTVRTRKTRDLSALWISVLCFGLFLYTLYGLILHNIPIILSSLAGFILTAILLVYKARYK